MNDREIIERTISLTTELIKKTAQPNIRKQIITQVMGEIQGAKDAASRELSQAQPWPSGI